MKVDPNDSSVINTESKPPRKVLGASPIELSYKEYLSTFFSQSEVDELILCTAYYSLLNGHPADLIQN